MVPKFVTTPSTDASPIADVALDAEASSSAEDLAPKGEQTPVPLADLHNTATGIEDARAN
eukprot:2278109-Amphidinium_carterae.1